MNKKKLSFWKIVLIVVVLLLFGMGAAIFTNFPKPLEVTDSAYDLQKLSDGTYIGNCDNGLVKVKVEVDIKNHAITDIRIIHHNNGRGGAAEVITDDVVTYQSVEVDAISGATASSKTILKAVENALSGME